MVGNTDERRRAIINRLAKAGGHLEAVRRMIEDGRDSTDVLIQLSAVKSALVNTEKLILKDYLEKCVDDAVSGNDKDAVQAMYSSIDRFLK